MKSGLNLAMRWIGGRDGGEVVLDVDREDGRFAYVLKVYHLYDRQKNRRDLIDFHRGLNAIAPRSSGAEKPQTVASPLACSHSVLPGTRPRELQQALQTSTHIG